MIAHDDEFFDSIAALALGILPASEAQPLAKHVAICADCRMVYASLRSSADFVGYEAEAVGERFDEVSRFRLKSRIMKTIRSGETAPAAETVPATNGKPATPPRFPRAWIAYACAAAAIVVAALDTIANNSLSNDNARLASLAGQQSSAAASASAHARELDRQLAQVLAPDSTSYPVAFGEVVKSPTHIVIALRSIPPPPPGKLYQAWTRKAGAAVMTPGATFGPDAAGVAIVEVPTGTPIDAVAVSIEPASGSKAPTSKPVFFRTFS